VSFATIISDITEALFTASAILWPSSPDILETYDSMPFGGGPRHRLPGVPVDHLEGERERAVAAPARFQRGQQRLVQAPRMRAAGIALERLGAPPAHVLQQGLG
jgi:hypothetical protein